jgi:hypothetical protein
MLCAENDLGSFQAFVSNLGKEGIEAEELNLPSFDELSQ